MRIWEFFESSQSGYYYHATNMNNLHDMLDSGYMEIFDPWHGTDQETGPDGSTEKRAYFSSDIRHIWSFAPVEGKAVALRVPKNATVFKKERYTNDIYTTRPIDISYIEYLDHNKWTPLTSLRN
jgi:hypothetical protein